MNREYRIIIIIALIVSVIAITIGFATYTSTLLIRNDKELQTSNYFDMYLSYIKDSNIERRSDDYVNVVSTGELEKRYWSGIELEFNGPGKAEISASMANYGIYDAYLTKVMSIENGKLSKLKCKAVGDTDQEIVDLACKNIFIKVTISDSHDDFISMLTSERYMDDFVDRRILLKQRHGTNNVTLNFEYKGSEMIPDGSFEVFVPTIYLIYESMPLR